MKPIKVLNAVFNACAKTSYWFGRKAEANFHKANNMASVMRVCDLPVGLPILAVPCAFNIAESLIAIGFGILGAPVIIKDMKAAKAKREQAPRPHRFPRVS